MTTPKQDGFFMPAEFSPHSATIMIFPERPGSWHYNAEPALPEFLSIWKNITQDEQLYLLVSPRTEKKAADLLQQHHIQHVQLLTIDQNDAWARDTAPTFVTNHSEIRGIDWKFNAWGGTYDGLYADWEKDNALASALCQKLSISCYNAQNFVLEGGSIHSNGKGMILTTEACLLSRGRNPHLSKMQIQQMLLEYLGANRIIWLPHGIDQDETNEHVDNICAFVQPEEVVLSWTDDRNLPQYAFSHSCMEILQKENIRVHKLPLPDEPVRITEHDLAGYVFEEGETPREVGEQLAASYVNFYFTNRSVLVPQFGGKNQKSDENALEILSRLCPNRKIIPIPARELLLGGGNIHCLTQQIPAIQKGEIS